ncbi:MAG TPA: NAD+ synthase [Spirochaetia bacterium]|nr:MAG: hypothetical protein A2Y41_10630 [Spirochaetes bacterium GWB1_36_13]HCL55786.1 NAD+ synthase [Spirochaetia bacterium]
MKILISQLDSHIGNFEKNYQKIMDASLQAAEEKADLIIFPELFLTGYPPMDLLDKPFFWDVNEEYVQKLLKNLPKEIGVIFGSIRKPHFNTAYFIYQGKMLYQDKTLLPTYDVFDEDRYFFPADQWNTIDFKGKKLFLTVCEDIWDGYAFNPHEKVGAIDLLINISASPFELHKLNKRISLVKKIVGEKNCPALYVNMVGGNDELIFDGGSFAMEKDGTLSLLAEQFQEDFKVYEFESKKSSLSYQEDPYQELEEALVLGIKDYFAKTGFKKAVLGISGGIDSALVCALAVKALGKENVMGILMPGPYSTDHSITDAKALADKLGIQSIVIPIKNAYHTMIDTLDPVLKGTAFDVTEENIQSRLRGVIIMAYSNKMRALALNTGNKSEFSTGYCTLYGDMAGALAVIGDIYKTQVYELSRHLNKNGEIIPVNSIVKPPSAELRENQVDQDSLPPYDVLDRILYLYLEENYSAAKIAETEKFNLELVNSVFHKIHISEYKRRQAPIVLKVSHKAFGSGRRIPVSNGFK